VLCSQACPMQMPKPQPSTDAVQSCNQTLQAHAEDWNRHPWGASSGGDDDTFRQLRDWTLAQVAHVVYLPFGYIRADAGGFVMRPWQPARVMALLPGMAEYRLLARIP